MGIVEKGYGIVYTSVNNLCHSRACAHQNNRVRKAVDYWKSNILIGFANQKRAINSVELFILQQGICHCNFFVPIWPSF